MSNIASELEKAAALLSRQQFKQAIDCLERALTSEPQNAQARYYKGCAFSKLEDYQQAISCFTESAKYAGERACLPLYNMGNAYQSLNKFDEAMESFRAALKVDNTMADAWINLGRLLDDRGDHEEALACYELALQFQPDDEVAWCNRGNTLRSLRRFEEALSSYDRALELAARDSDTTYLALAGVAGCLPHLGREDEALELINELLKSGDAPPLLVDKAIILASKKQFPEALDVIDYVIQLGTETAEVYNNRGEIL